MNDFKKFIQFWRNPDEVRYVPNLVYSQLDDCEGNENSEVLDEIKNYVAELECAMECENIKMEEGDYDEVPAEVRRQQADRLADMDNTYSILNDKLIEYELTR